MDFNRDPMDFSRHEDKAYFMIGNLVSIGEVVGERFIGLPCFAEKICLGGVLPETVDVKMEDMDDFCNQHITYGVFGNKELNEVSFESREVIKESRNRLLQLGVNEYPYKLEGERLVYEVHYIDAVGLYQSRRVNSLEAVLDTLKGLNAIMFESFPSSKKFLPYLEFTRRGYLQEIKNGRAVSGDCSDVSPYIDKKAGKIKLFAYGFLGNSTNGVCRFSKFISKARVEDDGARVSDVRVLDFSQCSRLSSIVYNHLIDEQKYYSENMSIVFPKFVVKSDRCLCAEEFNISARKFQFVNFSERVVFERLRILGGVEIVGADDFFTVEHGFIGDGKATVTGLKELKVGNTLDRTIGRDSSLHIIDTDSEEITLVLYHVAFPEEDRKYFEIKNCKKLRKLTVICPFGLDLGVILRGIEGCDALTEIVISANVFRGASVSTANRKRFGFAEEIGYKNLKRLELKGLGWEDLDRQFKVSVPNGCEVVCNNKKLASRIIKEKE